MSVSRRKWKRERERGGQTVAAPTFLNKGNKEMRERERKYSSKNEKLFVNYNHVTFVPHFHGTCLNTKKSQLQSCQFFCFLLFNSFVQQFRRNLWRAGLLELFNWKLIWLIKQKIQLRSKKTRLITGNYDRYFFNDASSEWSFLAVFVKTLFASMPGILKENQYMLLLSAERSHF